MEIGEEKDGYTYDLEGRLLQYAVRIVSLTDALPNTRAGNHVASQLLRSGTAPLSNHGEAQAAESNDDFIHKMKICLKELKESRRWLKLIREARLMADVEEILNETEALVRIFAASIRTAGRQTKVER